MDVMSRRAKTGRGGGGMGFYNIYNILEKI